MNSIDRKLMIDCISELLLSEKEVVAVGVKQLECLVLRNGQIEKSVMRKACMI